MAMHPGYSTYPAPTAVHAPFPTAGTPAGFPGERIAHGLPTGPPAYGLLAAPQGFPHLGPAHQQFPNGYYQPTAQAFAPPPLARTARNYAYNEAPPASEEQLWDELTDEEQGAAEELGYTRHSWNHNAVMPWDRMDWAALTPMVRERLAVLGWTAPSWDYHEVEIRQHDQAQAAARQPNVEHSRVYIEKMAPRVPGGRPLTHKPQMESNVTLGPCGHLAPVGDHTKQWYNTRIYVPEVARMKGYAPQYLDRFVQTEEGLWVDTLKCQQRESFWNKQKVAYQKQVQEDLQAQSGEGIVLDGHWSDAYTGDSLLEAQGRLCNASEFKAKHNIHKSDWRKLEESVMTGWSFDNLRVPWVFDDGRVSTAKMVMPSVYAFERQAPTYAGDARFHVEELGHAYVRGEKMGV